MFATEMRSGLIFSSQIGGPIDVARVGTLLATSALALHATFWPKYRDTDLVLFFVLMASFVGFSVAYLVWLRLPGRSRHFPAPGSSAPGSGTPPEFSPLPVPTSPRTPVMHRGEAQALPREDQGATVVMAVGISAEENGEPGTSANTAPPGRFA